MMCELLGIVAKRRFAANDLLRAFYSHADEHPHGWGLARFDRSGPPSIDKEPVAADKSAFLAGILDSPVLGDSFIAHIRRATVGDLAYANCHPFAAEDNCGRTWTLAHNGTIFSGVVLNAYIGQQFGETDSERVLLHVVEQVNAEQIRLGRALDESERFGVLSGVVAELADGNKLNLILHDGELMYVHTNFRDSLFYRELDGALVFSTRQLDSATWHHVPFARLVSAKDGEMAREGVCHGHEYIFNPEDYRMVYLNFARL